MHDLTMLRDFTVIFVIVVPVALFAHRLRLPAIVVYLLSGAVIGPHALGLIGSQHVVEMLAEMGVVLLLFTIGLEFSLRKLMRLRQVVAIGGGLQVLVTMGLVTLLGLQAMDWNLTQSIAVGAMVALSSTVIVLKTLAERNELAAPHGNVSLGILLFQDLALVPLMLLFRLLGESGSATTVGIAFEIGLAIAGVILILAGGRLLLPYLFRAVAATNQREVFMLAVLAVIFGTAYGAHLFGMSLGLGAFLAGLVISESEYADQIVADAIPMRDALSSLFFISIGMLLEPVFLYENMGWILLAVTLVFIGKAIITTLVAILNGFNIRVSLVAGLALAQIGEFSLVLALIAFNGDVIGRDLYQGFIGTSVLGMIAAPFVVRYADRIGYRISDLLGWKRQGVPINNSEDEALKLKGHIVVVGFGKIGMYLSHVLKSTGLKYLLCELNGLRFRGLRAEGHPGVYGDAANAEILEKLHIHDASTLVLTTGTLESLRRTIEIARGLNQNLYIIARTRYIADLEELIACGADQVVTEEMQASVEIFSLVLRKHHVPRSVVANQVAIIRNERYAPLLGKKLRADSANELVHYLAATATESLLVTSESAAVGKTIGEIGLSEEKKLTIIALVRNEDVTHVPPPDTRLEAGDILLMIGTHAAIDRGIEKLGATIVQ